MLPWLIPHESCFSRDATNSINTLMGAGGAMLDNPVKRFARDINTAANHKIFEHDVRYADHARLLLEQAPKSFLA